MLLDVIASSRRRGFSPLSLSPALWLDASDASTLFDATTGGSLVAADGAVARWEDKSGNARHATQATLSLRPERSGDALLFSDGQKGFSFPELTTIRTSFFVVEPSIDGMYFLLGHSSTVDFHRGETPPHAIWASFDSWFQSPTFLNGSSVNGRTTTIPLQRSLISAVWSKNMRASTISRDRGNAFGARSWRGYYCETLQFTTQLSTTDRQAVESYLASKWGITLAS
jgi:hypothetical protein